MVDAMSYAEAQKVSAHMKSRRWWLPDLKRVESSAADSPAFCSAPLLSQLHGTPALTLRKSNNHIPLLILLKELSWQCE